MYLLDAMRVNDPNLLAKDWYTTHTLQYHFLFTHLSALLYRLNVVHGAFFTGYVLIVVFFQLAWFKFNQLLGGNRNSYLLSNLFFWISAGGLGLGVFDFLQDASFVPSNVANIAMLWAMYYWAKHRPAIAGLLFGLAGLFHVNHALVGIALWFGLIIGEWIKFPLKPSETAAPEQDHRGYFKGLIIGTTLILAFCLPNLIPSAIGALRKSEHKISLNEFVNLYVHLRHPHHYDPLTWPIVLWLSLFWTFPLAWLQLKKMPWNRPARESCSIVILICAMMTVAFFTAGVWFILEPMVQASLFRFSIYPKLLGCIGAAIYLLQKYPQKRLLQNVSIIAAAATLAVKILINHLPPIVAKNELVLSRLIFVFMAITILVDLCEMGFESNPNQPASRRRFRIYLTVFFSFLFAIIGLNIAVDASLGKLGSPVFTGTVIEPDYQALCEYCQKNTPADSLFIVPPEEQEFRLRAQRAIVVNFKGVAQLSAELGEWRDRLCRLLDINSLDVLPKQFSKVFDDLARRYAALSPEHLKAVADQYGVNYIITTHSLKFPEGTASLIHVEGRFFLYQFKR